MNSQSDKGALPPAEPLQRLGLFQGYGIEVEYMIVDTRTAEVLPIADAVLVDSSGEVVSTWGNQEVAWSNELVLHVLELKNPTPVARLDGLPELFSKMIREANHRLGREGACLMPGGAHPFMLPERDTQLWPHEGVEIYRIYDDIFGCATHGYANLQSVHFNLPFWGDQEFARLHQAIRIVLPLIPAIAASSPIIEGRSTGFLDTRLRSYRSNAAQFPSITRHVVPEPIESEQQYREQILRPMYREIAGSDPEGLLQDEWLNSRGAIARFDRSAIEIRVMDTQECPTADIAILQLIGAVLERLVREPLSHYRRQLGTSTGRLVKIYERTVRWGDEAVIDDIDYLRLLNMGERPQTALEIWRSLRDQLRLELPARQQEALNIALERGPLARRLLERVGASPTRESLGELAHELCRCLAADRSFQHEHPLAAGSVG